LTAMLSMETCRMPDGTKVVYDQTCASMGFPEYHWYDNEPWRTIAQALADTWHAVVFLLSDPVAWLITVMLTVILFGYMKIRKAMDSTHEAGPG